MTAFGALSDHGKLPAPYRYYVRVGRVGERESTIGAVERELRESHAFNERITKWCYENSKGEWDRGVGMVYFELEADYIKFMLAF